jgi:tetratricopeptide (TPR) repeat protein
LKQYLYPILLLLFLGCKGDAELAMERGIQYYEWEKIEKAILEFKYVIHTLSVETGKKHYQQIQLLSRAYHNLAIAYAKKTWYKDAFKEAEKAFELVPTDNNRKVMELIQKKISGKSESLSSP